MLIKPTRKPLVTTSHLGGSPPTRVNRRHMFKALAAAPAALSLAACGEHRDTIAEPMGPPRDITGNPFTGDDPIIEETGMTYVPAADDGFACEPTEQDVEGPFFLAGSPSRVILADANEPGQRMLITGQVSKLCETPAEGYIVDVWQADSSGAYHGIASNYRLRGNMAADDRGFFAFETIVPGHYAEGDGFRPRHLHVKVYGPNGQTVLTTQLYFQGDPYLAPNDSCPVNICKSDDPERTLPMYRAQWQSGGEEKTGVWGQVALAVA